MLRWGRFAAIVIAASLICGAVWTQARAALAQGQAAPSGFTVRPDITDPSCNGGQGLTFGAHLGEIPVVASTGLANGSTLIALSSGGFPDKNTVSLYSITSACVANNAFGQDGASRIGPAQPPPRDTSPAGEALKGLQIDVVAPAIGGGVLLAGGYGYHWIVGEINADGTPDTSFGDDGWSVLPFHGEVSSIDQAPSGQIFLAGSAGSGCCTTNSLGALSSTGLLNTAFGEGGRVGLPAPVPDSGVAQVLVEPNGDVLASVAGGNMGTWLTALVMVTPAGRPVPGFRQHLNGFWKTLGFATFQGTTYVNGAGFTVIGTGQDTSYSSKPAPSSTGVIATFSTGGSQVGSTTRFGSRLFGAPDAFLDEEDVLFVDSPYANATKLTLKALGPGGSLDASFADRGIAQVAGPGHGLNASLDTEASVSQSSPGTIVIVSLDGKNQIHLTRLDVNLPTSGP
jgi:hypothetical protein